MNNFWLFLITTFSYWGIWFILKLSCKVRPKIRQSMEMLWIIALLSLPLNYGEIVVTILGSAQGENVLSIFSPYQKAEKKAVAVIGGIVQKAGKGALVICGPMGYQEADTVTIAVGVGGYQKANYKATVGVGMSVCQKIPSRSIEWFRVFGSTKTKKRLN